MNFPYEVPLFALIPSLLIMFRLNWKAVLMLKHFVIQSEAKNLAYIYVYVPEILPPFGRLND
jgi:hypothetical protein